MNSIENLFLVTKARVKIPGLFYFWPVSDYRKDVL